MSPRSKQQNEEIREQRLQEILRATIKIYAAVGYRGTQMDEVAKEAKIAKGLLYYYFKSKNELFMYVFEYMINGAVDAATQMTAYTLASLRQVLEGYIKFYIHSIYEHPEMALFYYRMEEDLRREFPEAGVEMQQKFAASFQKPLVQAFERAISSGEIAVCNPVIAASIFWLGLCGVMLVLAQDKKPSDTEQELVRQATRQLLDGIFTR